LVNSHNLLNPLLTGVSEIMNINLKNKSNGTSKIRH
jgi:hypothetical protein